MVAPCYQIRHPAPKMQLSKTLALAEKTICGDCYPRHSHRRKTVQAPSRPRHPLRSHLEICFHSQPRTPCPLRKTRPRKLSCPRTAGATPAHASIRLEINNTGFRTTHSPRRRSTAQLRQEKIAGRRCFSNQTCCRL